ncbi:hypothetical protein [Bizionia echini]|nr:hypothetical protein [Bizionia echini]
MSIKGMYAFTLISNVAEVDINDTIIELPETEIEMHIGTYVFDKEKTDKIVFIQDKATLVYIMKVEFMDLKIIKIFH